MERVGESEGKKKQERKNNGPDRVRTDNLLHTGQLRYHLRHWDADFSPPIIVVLTLADNSCTNIKKILRHIYCKITLL